MSLRKFRGQLPVECLAAAAAAVCLCASAAPAAQPATDTKGAAPRPTQPPLSGPGSLTGVWANPAFKDYRTGPPVGREPTLETADQVTVLFEFYGTFRIIHLNEKHQTDPDPTYFGDSVGHWEGNTLVVDTIGLTDKTTLFGAPHGQNLHIVERIRRTGPNSLEDSMTIEDPQTFTRPFNWLVTLKQFPGMRIGEFVCDNQRNGVGVNGETSVQLQTSER